MKVTKKKFAVYSALIIVSIFAALAAYFLSSETSKPTTNPQRFRYRNVSIDGIDVSHHNTVNWSKVAKKSNVRFAYIKVIEGRTHKDKKFKQNVREARKNGISVGGYLLYSKLSTPKAQFDVFKAIYDNSNCDLIPAIDIESDKFQGKNKTLVARRVAELSRLMEQHYGRKPLLYCSDFVYRHYLHKYLPDNPVWVANYHRIPVVYGHKGYLWQFASRGTVAGVRGHIDVDHLQGTMTLQDLKLNRKK